MKIGISMEMTRKLRDTWHSALNHEWYDFMSGHDIVPISCHGVVPQTDEFDLIILAGGNDMIDIKTWRDNHYPLRDVFERRLIEQAMLTKTPVMGICRGAHFINWVLGGTHRLMETPYDNVVVNLSVMQVTCHHTICIDKLAPGFEILETDSNGVIELAVHRKNRMLGVGWHPERLVNAHSRNYVLEIIDAL
jgi:putative glutamine amidotransferase